MNGASRSGAPLRMRVLEGRERDLVTAAARSFSTPFFCIDVDRIRERFASFRSAWLEVFPRARFAYSYKTNPLPVVTRALLRDGACAEVVSGVELEWALEDGAAPRRIFFDGPAKTEQELARALELGAHVQVDSVDEARIVARLFRPGSSASEVRLRLATPRADGEWSRFGLFADEVSTAYQLLERAGARISGVHLHAGSNVGAEVHVRALEACGPIIQWFRMHCGESFSIDLGGGYAALTAHEAPSPPGDYARGVAAALRRLGIDPVELPVILEPGRCLVEDAGVLATRVLSYKRRGERNIVVCDAGTHLMRSARSWRHEVHVLEEPAPAAAESRVELFGANCFEGDLLGPELTHAGTPERGDMWVIGGCGGYDIASSAGWITPRAPVISCEGAHQQIARRRQTPAELRGVPPGEPSPWTSQPSPQPLSACAGANQ